MSDILLFARLLRDAGLSVAPSEIAEGIESVQLLGLSPPGSLHYRAMQATLVKRVEDQHVFQVMYRLFYGDVELSDADERTTGETVTFTDQGLKSAGLSTVAAAMLDGNLTPCHNNIKDAVSRHCQRDLPIEESVRRALVSLDYFGALNSIRLRKERGILTEWEYQTALENAECLLDEVQQEVLRRLLSLGAQWQDVTRQLNWREKSFNLLSSAEMRLVRRYLDKIGRKLAVKPGVKSKPNSAGDLDLRQTLRKAMASGGGVWKLVHSRRIPAKPDLVLMCDVSNSVYRFTGFMLQLVAAFRERFSNVRAFTFVDILWEIPSNFFQGDIQEALEDIKENNRCSISGLSDFGQVFNQFATAVLPELTPQTTLLILGDGRSNWRPPEVGSFKQIAERVKRVYWLNPLAREEWGREDCQLAQYSPYCDGVFECGNLVQLEQAALKIL